MAIVLVTLPIMWAINQAAQVYKIGHEWELTPAQGITAALGWPAVVALVAFMGSLYGIEWFLNKFKRAWSKQVLFKPEPPCSPVRRCPKAKRKSA